MTTVKIALCHSIPYQGHRDSFSNDANVISNYNRSGNEIIIAPRDVSIIVHTKTIPTKK